MTKADLIEEVSRVVEMTRKESEVIVEAIFDSIVRSLRTDDKIEIRGFGSFRTRQRQPRIGRNPKTGARVEVPAKKIPYFKPSKELKDVVNNSPTPAVAPRPTGARTASPLIHGLSVDSLALPVHHQARGARRVRSVRGRAGGR
jgi:integration host factor subunit beta